MVANHADEEPGLGKLYLREPAEYQDRDEAGTGEAGNLTAPSYQGVGGDSAAKQASNHTLTFLL